MSLVIFRNIIHCALLVFCFSCKRHSHKDNGINTKTHNTETTKTIRNVESESHFKQIKLLNYDTWDIFWKNFTTAAKKKDTSTIIALTNFPFSQNSYLIDQDEFLQYSISQLFDVRKSDSPVLGDPTLIQLDSSRYMNKNGKDIYFEKINGYYRLVRIVTPG